MFSALNTKLRKKVPYFWRMQLFKSRLQLCPPALWGGAQVWLKREDELGPLGGSKSRRYALLPAYSAAAGIRRWLAMGGSQSNNLLGLALLAAEHQIELQTFEPPRKTPAPPLGNERLRELVGRGAMQPQQRNYLPAGEWQPFYLKEECVPGGISAKDLFLPEGTAHPLGYAGMISIMDEIAEQTKEWAYAPEWIAVECGRGTMALSIAQHLHQLQQENPARWGNTRLLITLIGSRNADDLFETAGNIASRFSDFRSFLSDFPVPDARTLAQAVLNPLPEAKGFGSISKSQLNNYAHFAAAHGLLADPVYGLKHLRAVKYALPKLKSRRGVIIIQTGTALGLSHFAHILGEA